MRPARRLSDEKSGSRAARSGSAQRDRAQTIRRVQRVSAWREGKGRGCGPPAA
jgi:hypothetical protein